MIPGVTFHPRASWQDPRKPITGPAPIPNRIDTFVVHYTAADDLIDGDPGERADDLPAYLRSMQSSYLSSRGYSVGYNFAVDWLGGVWELRGFDVRCAANKGWNERSIAVLCLVDGQDPLTVEALRSVNAIYAEANRRYRPLALKGHRDVGATQCPGTGIYAQIRAGLIRPQARPPIEPAPPITPPPPPTGDDDMPVIAYIAKPPIEADANAPWFVCIDGQARYATNIDAAAITRHETLNAEQYAHLARSVFGGE